MKQKYISLFTTGLIILIELVIGLAAPFIEKNPTVKMIQAKLDHASDREYDYTYMILGDSSATAGIQASLLSTWLEEPVYNFATIGNVLIAGNYFLLKRYVATHPPPKAIILMNVYNMWERDIDTPGVSEMIMRNYPLPALELYLLGIASLPINTKYLEHPSQHLLPSQKQVFNLQTLFSLHAQTRTNEPLQSQTPSKQPIPLSLLNSHPLKSNHFEVSYINQYYLSKLIALCRQHQINIWLTHPPLHEYLYNRYADKPYLIDYHRFMKKIEAENDNVTLITEGILPVPDSWLFDSADHLTSSASAIFTEKIYHAITTID